MRQTKREWPTSRREVVGANERHQLLELLLALDRTVMELALQLYNVPERHQCAMREQNRRLHDAVRDGLPVALSKRALMNTRPALQRGAQ